MESPLKEPECAICFEFLNLGDVAMLNCSEKHVFHAKCIGEWMLSRHNKRLICPLCVTENAEIINVKTSDYGNTWDHLFISDKHRRRVHTNTMYKPDENNEHHYEYQELPFRRQRTTSNNSEVDDNICCLPCMIL